MKTITSFFAIVAISLASVSVFAQPTVAPTAPISRPVSSVISIYGTDTYTPITGVNTFPDWGQSGQGSTFTTYTIAGTSHNLLKYGKLSYQGIDFTGNAQDVSGMKYLHMDIWTADAAVSPLSVAIINGNSNIAVSKTITTTGTWYSLDILLTEFTGQNLTAINQLMFKSTEWSTYATNTLQKDIYVDNIYFWTDVVPALAVSTTSLTIAQPVNSTNTFNITTSNGWTVASDQTWLTPSNTSGSGNKTITLTATANTTYATRTANITVSGSSVTKTIVVTQSSLMPTAAPTPAVNASNVISVYSDAYTNIMRNDGWQNWYGNTFSTVSINGNSTLNDISTCCFGANFTTASVNITSMTKLHVDVFPTVSTTMDYGFVTASGNPSKTLTLITGQWNSVDLNLSSDLAAGDHTQVQQIGFWNVAGTFYLDNVLFYNGTYSTSTGISSVIADNGIKCYPSMAKNSLNVSADKEISEISIVSLVGQSLRTLTVNSNSKTITLNDLVSGQYLVRIKLANGQIGTTKFVKL